MSESLEVTAFFPGVAAERLYRAWLDSADHTAFTGSQHRLSRTLEGVLPPGMATYPAIRWIYSRSG